MLSVALAVLTVAVYTAVLVTRLRSVARFGDRRSERDWLVALVLWVAAVSVLIAVARPAVGGDAAVLGAAIARGAFAVGGFLLLWEWRR